MSADRLKSHACPPADPSKIAGVQHVQPNEAGEVPKGTLSAERMHTILRRLNDGFYDAAEVRTVVAGRLALDIYNSTGVEDGRPSGMIDEAFRSARPG